MTAKSSNEASLSFVTAIVPPFSRDEPDSGPPMDCRALRLPGEKSAPRLMPPNFRPRFWLEST